MRRTILAALLTAAGCVPQAALAAPVGSHVVGTRVCAYAHDRQRWELFRETRATRADFVRMSVVVPCMFEDVVGEPLAEPAWAGLDETVIQLRLWRLRMLGVLDGTPKMISSCFDRYRPEAYRCPPADLDRYGAMVGEIAARARGAIDHWEVRNEPDQSWFFTGTPEDYAHMLRAAHDGIKARAPEAKVVLGGLSHARRDWMARVFATPGAHAAEKFDIASVHLRGGAEHAAQQLRRWRRFLTAHGFDGPVWVTEHGYPRDAALQYDPRFSGGLQDQAAYLTESVLGLGLAGAERVFVTLDDMGGTGPFDKEGITHLLWTIYREEPIVTRHPAFHAVRRLNRHWPALLDLARRRRAARVRDPRAVVRLTRRIAGPYRASASR